MYKELFKKLVFFTSLVSSLLVSNAFASGTGGYSNSFPQQRQVDQVYEYGKSVYNGRFDNGQKLDYCIKVDDELTPLKRKSAKTFKGGSAQVFAASLFDCNETDKLIGNKLTEDQFAHVVYYLNKRWKLKLK